jgi:hypothetical protein
VVSDRVILSVDHAHDVGDQLVMDAYRVAFDASYLLRLHKDRANERTGCGRELGRTRGRCEAPPPVESRETTSVRGHGWTPASDEPATFN